MRENGTPARHADETLSVFIAYRQGEGDEWAAALHALLDNATIALEDGRLGRLRVYWDKAAPTIDDFRKLWKGHLRTARAFILVCTAGTKLRRAGQRDWLFDEIEWWTANRRTGPILIDPLGGGEGHVPDGILEKWPFAQRATWSDDANLRKRIEQGIVLSERGVRFQELSRLRRLNLGLLALLVLAVALGYLAYGASKEAQRRAIRAESNLLVADSRQAQGVDPTLAYRIAEEAYNRDPTNAEGYRRLLDAYYSSDAFNVILARHASPPSGTTLPIYSASQIPGTDSLVLANLHSPKALQVIALDGKPLETWPLAHPADFALVSPDKVHVLTTQYGSHQVHLLDPRGRHLRAFDFPDRVEAARFSPDGASILVGAGNHAYLWSIAAKAPSHVFRGHTNWVLDVAFSADGRYVLTAGDFTARIWDRDGKPLRVLNHPDHVTSVAMHGAGNDARIATTCWDKLVRLWWPDGRLVKTYAGHGSRVYSAAFSPDGSFLATASWDNTVRVWHGTMNLATNAIKVLRGHASGVERVSFLSSGDRVLSAGSDATLRLWDIATPKTVERKMSMRDNQPFATLPSDPYPLKGTYRGIEMLARDGKVFFALPLPFEDRVFQAMYSEDRAYVFVRRYPRKFPVDAREIQRLVNVEQRFGRLPARSEIEAAHGV